MLSILSLYIIFTFSEKSGIIKHAYNDLGHTTHSLYLVIPEKKEECLFLFWKKHRKKRQNEQKNEGKKKECRGQKPLSCRAKIIVVTEKHVLFNS